MNYIKFGESKKYIVFLHGWGSDKNSFIWLKNEFLEYTKVFVDFAGFGDTPEPSKPYMVLDYVLDLKQLLDNFEIDDLILVGHSFGGRVAIRFSFLYQNNYSNYKLCLVDSAGLKPRRGFKYYYNVYKYKISKKIFPNSNSLKKYGSEDYKKLSANMKKTFINIVNEDLSCYASYITAKTLIIWGDNDRETRLYMAKKLRRLIRNSRLEIIKNSGHFPFLDKPYSFIIILDTFLKN